MQGENFCREIIDSLSAHIAVLDRAGTIILTNRAWQDFGAANSLKGPADSLGQNYISITEQSGDPAADIIAKGIRKVISGELMEFFTNYPCHSPTEKRWYAMRVTRSRFIDPNMQVVVSHEDITPIMQAQEKLRVKEEELSRQKTMLEESNVALRVLLEHREKDRRRLEDNILVNIRKLVLPPLEELGRRISEERGLNLLGMVQERLEEVVDPFLNRLTAVNRLLTPREIDVATLVREGRTSKEIADLLNVSVSAVDFHRKKIRKKMGLNNDKANLRSYLLSLR